MSSRKSNKDLSKDSINYSSGKSIRRISPLDKSNKTRRVMKYASSVAYASTIGALKKGQIPIIDPLIVTPLHKRIQILRGKTPEEIKKNRAADKKMIDDLINKYTKRNAGGKRANKTRKNVSRKTK